MSRNVIQVRLGGRRNSFYLFGGKDESSAALIQGITLAGALLDEAALMPRSFVEQACARCSVQGGRLWFSCNPAGPEHWFYREWICKAEEKRVLYLRFSMDDNPALAPQVPNLLEKDGVFLCSGIIDTRAHEVGAALKQAGLTLIKKREKNGWAALEARR